MERGLQTKACIKPYRSVFKLDSGYEEKDDLTEDHPLS
jgi:hypothetical protein